MPAEFVRQLGKQPGIQLNPLKDNSDGFAPDNADQVFAIAMRAKRGRIDRPFKVHKGNVLRKLGSGESIRANALNEALVQVYEAVNVGASEAVVHRLVPAASAQLSYIVATAAALPAITASTLSVDASDNSINDSANGFLTAGFAVGQRVTVSGFTGSAANNSATGRVVTAVTAGKLTFGGADGDDLVNDADGESVTLTAIAGPGVGDITYSVSATVPVVPFLFALKHLACFNDGIKVAVHADTVTAGGIEVANRTITLAGYEPNGDKLFEFEGSLDPTAVDDFGKSLYLPDVIAQSEAVPDVELTVGANQTIRAGSNAYGRDANTGLSKSATSAVLLYFTEGGTVYAASDLQLARTRLKATEHDYAYIASGGTQSTALLAQLAQLTVDTNRQLRIDVPGTMTPAQAAAWVASLGLDNYYVAYFWAPQECDDPLNGGKVVLGTAAYNIAKACLRNADTNAQGFARKNQPIAGKEFPLQRTGLKQVYTPDEFELSDLARAKINPVLFSRFSGGGLYVFTDSLTAAATDVSLRKLITTADMSSTIDETVVRFGKEALQLPMTTAVNRIRTFLQTLFEGAQAAGWIIPSAELAGKAFQFEVKPNQLRPADRVDVSYSLRYDGVARQIFVSQTLSR